MNTYKEKIKIAVVAPPFSGHLYPILELVLPLLKNTIFVSIQVLKRKKLLKD